VEWSLAEGLGGEKPGPIWVCRNHQVHTDLLLSSFSLAPWLWRQAYPGWAAAPQSSRLTCRKPWVCILAPQKEVNNDQSSPDQNYSFAFAKFRGFKCSISQSWDCDPQFPTPKSATLEGKGFLSVPLKLRPGLVAR
jgi:hypothetical protein